MMGQRRAAAGPHRAVPGRGIITHAAGPTAHMRAPPSLSNLPSPTTESHPSISAAAAAQ